MTDTRFPYLALRPPAHTARPIAHLVGACGAGMRALADVLQDLGWHVTGSDLQRPTNPHIRQGHHPDNIAHDVLFVVVSAAVNESNPEVMAARQRGLPILTYPQALRELLARAEGIGVAGTHGKSTTTALMGHILRCAGRAPTVVCGAESIDSGRSGWGGSGDLAVVESCEYRRHFLMLPLRHAVILDIEADHFDCFPDARSTIDAYREFVARIPADGRVICYAGRSSIREAVQGASACIETFDVEELADWSATGIVRSGHGVQFQVLRQGAPWGEPLRVPLCGRHNIGNALAACAMCHACGVSFEAIRDALSSFRGLKRRFQRIGERLGATVISDYAHHPTALTALLQTAKEHWGGRIRCVFQPHQVSRTEALFDEFVGSLACADEALLVPVYEAREAQTERAVELSRRLAKHVAASGTPARFVPSLDRLQITLETDTRPGDVVLFTGAGDIDEAGHEFVRRIPRHYAS